MDMICQMEPWFDDNERKALNEYMNAGGWLTEFRKTKEFEEMIAEFTGAKHCIVVNNGTISLTLALIALGIKHNDEVIVPNYTMIATPNAVTMTGAKPIFVDVELETLCMDFELARKAVTKKSKAIILVNANGRYPKVDYEIFLDFCKRNNIMLIEDSAQALGSFYKNNRHLGTIGKVGSFSFSTPKIITTGQGGALVTDDDDLADRIKKLKDFGRVSGGNDIHDTIGWNFKFTDLQAVIGIEQMKKLSWRVQRKKEILYRYQKNLKDCSYVSFFDTDLTNTTPWFIDILCEKRDNLKKYLKENNIGSRVMYPPINKQKAYNVKGDHPISNLVGKKGLWLPSQSQLTNEQIDYICSTINSFYNSL